MDQAGFEIFGDPGPLEGVAQLLESRGLPGLIGCRLDPTPRPDPVDGGRRHVLRVLASAPGPVWEGLYALGVRAWRWRPDPTAAVGVIVGAAPAEAYAAALDALTAAADTSGEALRLVCLIPPGPSVSDAAREVLRGRAQLLALGSASYDPDRPPERVELPWALLRSTALLPSAPAALSLLNQQAPRLLITPHRSLRLVSLESSQPHAPGEQALDPDGRYHLGLAPLRTGGGALLVTPDRARWIPV